jgi:hypothetical protein
MRQVYLGGTLINDIFLGDDRMADVLAGSNIVYDTDAQNFFNATGITNQDLRFAVNDFVVELKNNNLWNKMDLIYPFVADNTSSLDTQFGFNLKNTASFNPTFVNGVTDSNLDGYLAARNTRYISTNYNLRTERGASGPAHVSVYTTSTSEALDTLDFGGFINSTNNTTITTGRNAADGNSQKFVGIGGANITGGTGSFVEITNTNEAGYLIGSYTFTDTPKQYGYFNGVNIMSGSVFRDVAVTGSFDGTAFFGAVSSSAGAANGTNKRYQLLTVGDGLTQSEAGTLTTIVSTFQSDIDVVMGTSRSL